MDQRILVGLDARALHFVNEAFTRLVYTRRVHPGETVLDIGANEGLHTAELAHCVGTTGLVHAFEPNPAHFGRLLAIAEQVRLWPMALGRELSIETLHVPDGLDGWASLEDLAHLLPDRTIRRTTVVQVPLDGLHVPTAGRLSFMKIDVERREQSVLEGALETIRAHRPVIVAENVTEEIQRLMASVGYMGVDYFGTSLGDSAATVSGPARLPNALLVPEESGDVAPFLTGDSAEVLATLAQARESERKE